MAHALKMFSAIVAALLAAQVNGSTLSIVDIALRSACTGSVCCTAGCDFRVGDFHGCNAGVQFGGTCEQNANNPDGTLDVPSCDDVQVTLLRDPEGRASVDIFHKPSQTYDRYLMENCQQADAPGPGCVVTSGDGCDSRQILTGAQGR